MKKSIFGSLTSKQREALKKAFAAKKKLIPQDIFIKMDKKGRKSLETWSNKANWYTLSQIKKFEESGGIVALLPPKNYAVIDCDSDEAIKTVEQVLKTTNVKNVFSWKTPHGKHYLFKFNPDFRPTKLPTSIVGENYNGFHQQWDYKGFRKGHATLTGRVSLELVNERFQKDDIPEMPISLYPFFSKNVDFTDFTIGKQHSVMYMDWIPNLRRVFSSSKEAIRKLLYEVICDYYGQNSSDIKPWIDRNIESSWDKGVIEPTSFEHFGSLSHLFSKPKTGGNILSKVIDYDEIYKYMIDKFNIVRSEDFRVWYWNPTKRAYLEMINWELVVKHELTKEAPNIKPSLLSEVCLGLQHKIPTIPDPENDYLIYFANGVFDVSDGTFQSGLRFSKNIIPHNFDPKVYEKKTISSPIKKFFKNITSDPRGNHHKDLEVQLLELIGYSMSRITEYDKAFFLLGDGSNGKSVFLKLLTKILGKHNISSEDIRDLSENAFSSSEIYNKLANINGDISTTRIKDPSMFKKITSGDTISAQAKYIKAFKFNPYSTLIFGTNSVPYYRDTADSKAMERRIKIIPFLNEFKQKSKEFNQYAKLWKEITSEKMLTELAILGCKALERVVRVNGFSENTVSTNAHIEYRMKVNPVERYINDRNLCELNEKILDISVQYSEYKIWCTENGFTKPYNKVIFMKQFEKYYRDNNYTILKKYTIVQGKRQGTWEIFNKELTKQSK